MDNPNHHPLPEYPSSDKDVIFNEEPSDNDSDNSDPEYEEQMESLWKEFDEAKAELDAYLEEERLAQEARETKEEEAESERLMAEMWEESDEADDDWDD